MVPFLPGSAMRCGGALALWGLDAHPHRRLFCPHFLPEVAGHNMTRLDFLEQGHLLARARFGIRAARVEAAARRRVLRARDLSRDEQAVLIAPLARVGLRSDGKE